MATNNSINTTRSAFEVQTSATISNVTGDGTQYNILFDNTVFDLGSNVTLNSGGKTIFTAPKTGIYFFYAGVCLSGVSSTVTGGELALLLGGGTMIIDAKNPYNSAGSPTVGPQFSGGKLVSLSANATVALYILIRGSVKDVDIAFFNAPPYSTTFFGGYFLS